MRRSRRDLKLPTRSVRGVEAHTGRGHDNGTEPQGLSLEPGVKPVRFEMTVGAFLARQRAGALHEGPRAELVDGRAVHGQLLGPAEAAAFVTLSEAFRRAGVADLGVEVVTWAPLRLGPVDLVRAAVVLLPGPSYVERHHAGETARRLVRDTNAGIGGSYDPAATLLVAESVDAGLAQPERLARYAAAGVREVWLLDLRRGWIESLRSPWRGEYRSRTLWYPGESVPISGLATVSIEALQPP